MPHLSCELPGVPGDQSDRAALPGTGGEDVDRDPRWQGCDINPAAVLSQHFRGRVRKRRALRRFGHPRQRGGDVRAAVGWQPRIASASPSDEIDNRELVPV
ncbi:MAG TPA: hypothetical protein DCP25_18780 [Chloroflexi bacterium]|nr:hypothetical protein [Chloroflexota bacterium]